MLSDLKSLTMISYPAVAYVVTKLPYGNRLFANASTVDVIAYTFAYTAILKVLEERGFFQSAAAVCLSAGGAAYVAKKYDIQSLTATSILSIAVFTLTIKVTHLALSYLEKVIFGEQMPPDLPSGLTRPQPLLPSGSSRGGDPGGGRMGSSFYIGSFRQLSPEARAPSASMSDIQRMPVLGFPTPDMHNDDFTNSLMSVMSAQLSETHGVIKQFVARQDYKGAIKHLYQVSDEFLEAVAQKNYQKAWDYHPLNSLQFKAVAWMSGRPQVTPKDTLLQLIPIEIFNALEEKDFQRAVSLSTNSLEDAEEFLGENVNKPSTLLGQQSFASALLNDIE